MFLLPKKNWKLIPLICLKALDFLLVCPSFKVEVHGAPAPFCCLSFSVALAPMGSLHFYLKTFLQLWAIRRRNPSPDPLPSANQDWQTRSAPGVVIGWQKHASRPAFRPLVISYILLCTQTQPRKLGRRYHNLCRTSKPHGTWTAANKLSVTFLELLTVTRALQVIFSVMAVTNNMMVFCTSTTRVAPSQWPC